MKSRHKFIDDLFIVCDECGYNNFKDRFKAFGKCLGCGKTLDDRVYFKAKLSRMAKRTRNDRTSKRVSKILIF